MKKSFFKSCDRSKDQDKSALLSEEESDEENGGRPRFLFSSEKVVHDKESPLPTCCKNEPRDFQAYYRRTHSQEDEAVGGTPRPIGIVCNKCHREWLSDTEDSYARVKLSNDDEIEVLVIDSQNTIDDKEESVIVNIDATRCYTFKKKIPNSVGLQFLSMANSTRTLIDRKSDEIELLKSGDHIMWHRSYGVWHHQLITKNKGYGKYDIIHFDTKETDKLGTKVEVQQTEERNFRESKDGEDGEPYKINYSDSVEKENPLSLVLDRANGKLHNSKYRLFTNNCEHMVTFCKTGCHSSFQVYWLNAKLIFLAVRVVILILAIAIIKIINFTNINHFAYNCAHPVEELCEVLLATSIELSIFLFIVVLHWKFYLKRMICQTDRKRRVGEALMEALVTICMYCAHAFIPYCMGETEHLIVFSLFGIVGKCAGFFLGHYICQKIIRQPHTDKVDAGEHTGLSASGSRVINMSYGALSDDSRQQTQV